MRKLPLKFQLVREQSQDACGLRQSVTLASIITIIILKSQKKLNLSNAG